tara:strand:+ start:2001 stop:2426 length:426 start_codon:yes stop_codon:yes gene_type:complete
MNDLSVATNVIIESRDDPRINFTFMKKHDILNFEKNPDILYTDKLNYSIPVGENKATGLDNLVTLNYFDINNIQDGKLWFKEKYPNLPEEYWEIMAKYQFEEPFTKKQLKNAVKKLSKKGRTKENIEGLKINRNKVLVDFD